MAFQDNAELVSVDLSENPIDDAGVELIAAWLEVLLFLLQRFQTLIFSECFASQANQSVQRLEMRQVDMTSVGVTSLARALPVR